MLIEPASKTSVPFIVVIRTLSKAPARVIVVSDNDEKAALPIEINPEPIQVLPVSKVKKIVPFRVAADVSPLAKYSAKPDV
mgnify:CR=1 FL=1